MKAIVQDSYGAPDVLEFRDIDKPVAKDNEELVRVDAASLNHADWLVLAACLRRVLSGRPGVRDDQLQTPDRAGCHFLLGG